MGWWSTNEQGASFAEAENGQEMVWGDGPADVVDDAIDKIKEEFARDWERLPTKGEMMAGLTFSTAVAIEDLPATVEEAKALGLPKDGEGQ